MEIENINNSDQCRHPGRRDRPFCGDGAGDLASHIADDSTKEENQQSDERSQFKPRRSLARTPPGLHEHSLRHREPKRGGDQSRPEEDGASSPKLAFFDAEMPARRHSSPEDQAQQGMHKQGTKRTFEGKNVFSSPSLQNVKNIQQRFPDLERVSQTAGTTPQLKRAKKSRTSEPTPFPKQAVEEASSIAEKLAHFVADPGKKINKSNQAHINNRIAQLVELVVRLAEEVPSDPRPHSVAAERKNEDDPIIERILGKVAPVISAGLDRIMMQLTERTNAIVNCSTSAPTRTRASVKPARVNPVSGQKGLSTPVANRHDAPQEEMGNGEQYPPLPIINHREAPPDQTQDDTRWIKVGPKTRRPRAQRSANPGIAKEDVLKLIPAALIPHGAETAKTGGPTIVSIDIEQTNTINISAPEKAAKLVDLIQIDPAVLGDHIQKVSITNDGRMRVEMRDENSATKLMQEMEGKNTEDCSIKCRIQQQKQPRVAIRGVPQAWTEDKIISLFDKTMKDQQMEVGGDIRPLFKHGPKSATTATWIVAVSPAVRNTVITTRRLKYGIMSFACTDYVELPRCYKCQRTGHIARGCQEKEESCSWCAGTGHSHRICPNVHKRPKCKNCVSMGIRNDHAASDLNCQAHLRALAANIKRTSYG